MATTLVAMFQKQAKGIDGLRNHEWLTYGVGMIIRLAGSVKWLKSEKEDATRAIKIKYDLTKKPYDTDIKALEKIDRELRDRLLVEYTGTDNLLPDTGDGEIVIKKSWAASIVDESQVPMEYWSVDMSKVNQAVADGIRNISGVSISKVRSLMVLTERKES